ncbi:MAG: hypothetical protein IPM54_10145 [Polyangiaceae bacterium]|nr:hypothetical protein [Polyangiaceae bacterium]
MKHTMHELLQIVYQYYWRSTSYDTSEPYGPREALVEARKHAGRPNSAWQKLLVRLDARFPDRATNRSLHLAGGGFDACYLVKLEGSSNADGEPHDIGLAISFIAPYYVVYNSRHVKKNHHNYDEVWRLHPFDLADDEIADARAMVDEMKKYFPDHEPLPEEIGNIVVPDVLVCNQLLGMGTIYHCLFTDSWW